MDSFPLAGDTQEMLISLGAVVSGWDKKNYLKTLCDHEGCDGLNCVLQKMC